MGFHMMTLSTYNASHGVVRVVEMSRNCFATVDGVGKECRVGIRPIAFLPQVEQGKRRSLQEMHDKQLTRHGTELH